MTAPDFIWAWSWGPWVLPDGQKQGGYCRQDNRRPIDDRERETGAEYVRRDPAVLAELPEVKAMSQEVERLRKALSVASEDMYEALNSWKDEDYAGTIPGLTVPAVCFAKPYYDMKVQFLLRSAEKARAALEGEKE